MNLNFVRRLLREYPRNDIFRIDFSTPSEAYLSNGNQDRGNDGFDCFLCCKPKENKYNPGNSNIKFNVIQGVV